MDWKAYFESVRGVGYLATSGRDGAVDIAIYSRPHVEREGILSFGMTDRLTHANLQQNPQAVYAFNEGGFRGRRVFLEKIEEESAGKLLDEIRARADELVGPGTGDAIQHVVHFRVVKYLPLVGT